MTVRPMYIVHEHGALGFRVFYSNERQVVERSGGSSSPILSGHWKFLWQGGLSGDVLTLGSL